MDLRTTALTALTATSMITAAVSGVWAYDINQRRVFAEAGQKLAREKNTDLKGEIAELKTQVGELQAANAWMIQTHDELRECHRVALRAAVGDREFERLQSWNSVLHGISMGSQCGFLWE